MLVCPLANEGCSMKSTTTSRQSPFGMARTGLVRTVLAGGLCVAVTACSTSSPHVAATSANTTSAPQVPATGRSSQPTPRTPITNPSVDTTTESIADSTEASPAVASAAASDTSTADATQATQATQATTADPDTTTLPPGATAGLDDYDGDGRPDPTCGTQDFGAGLVLRIPCSIISANEPPEGTTLLANSLFRLPGEAVAEFESLSGSLLDARDAGGAKVRIIVFNTDGLFASGSGVINSFETMDAAIRAINIDFPNGAVQVRGHTDGVGTVAANQALSTKRAETVQAYLLAHGILATSVIAVGLANTEPLVSETNADGSPNLEGRHFNRRVEIVIRLAA